MRYITLFLIASILAISPAAIFAQSDKAEANRWAQIRFLHKQSFDQKLQVILKNHQIVEGYFDKTFYDYFILSQNRTPRVIQFADVEKITTPGKSLKRLKQIGKLPFYIGGTIISAPGGIIFYVYCVANPNHCK
jgi:hypothetical protein